MTRKRFKSIMHYFLIAQVFANARKCVIGLANIRGQAMRLYARHDVAVTIEMIDAC